MTAIESESPFKKPKENLPQITLLDETKEAAGFDVNQNESTVTITVVGASGDLAKKKIFPALFALFYEDCLPGVRTYLSFFISRRAFAYCFMEFYCCCSISLFLVMLVPR